MYVPKNEVISINTPPLVEKWVFDTFTKAGILNTSDMRADKLCEAFGIEYSRHFGVSGSKIIDRVPHIAIDCRPDLLE